MPPVLIMLADGNNLRSDEKNTNAVLSRFFERDVTLAESAPESPALEEYWPDIDGLAHRETVTDETIALSSPKGSFFDYAVAHILTTNTLNRLRELYPQGRFEARRFRPNIIVMVGKGEPDFAENSWVGLKCRNWSVTGVTGHQPVPSVRDDDLGPSRPATGSWHTADGSAAQPAICASFGIGDA